MFSRWRVVPGPDDPSSDSDPPERGYADWGAMLQSLEVIWGVGATFFLFVLVSGWTPHDGGTVLLCIDIIGFTVLGLLVVGRDHLPAWTPDLCAYLFYLVVGGVIFAYQDPDSVVAFFYLWLLVHSFYFLPWRRAAPQIAFIAINYAITLLAIGGAFPALRYGITMLTTVVIATFVGILRARVDALVTRLSGVARTDPLTGLPNRRAYDELIDLEIARADRTGNTLAVLMADVDHFKRINDRFGHPTGDIVLRRVADHLQLTGRRVDVAARVGGEEFVVLLPNTDTRGAFLVAERLRTTLRRSFAHDPMVVTMSFGIACYPEDGMDAASLFQAADTALLEAKADGRDRAVVYHGPLLGATSQIRRPQDLGPGHELGGRALEQAPPRD
ncbi:MAG: GGDEF domain-containing protein [Acidimicrobiales bacterium]